jgi:hypothetical protein
MTADPAEADRRRQLIDALSDSNITALSDQMRKARTALARRVYGGSELAVLDLIKAGSTLHVGQCIRVSLQIPHPLIPTSQRPPEFIHESVQVVADHTIQVHYVTTVVIDNFHIAFRLAEQYPCRSSKYFTVASMFWDGRDDAFCKLGLAANPTR